MNGELCWQLLGAAASVHALLNASTPQGGLAWALLLLQFPILCLPLYLLFGSTHFRGYVEIARTRVSGRAAHRPQASLEQHRYQPTHDRAAVGLLEQLGRFPFTAGNSVELLVDARETYPRMLQEIDQARDYVLVLFYKVEPDTAGKELQQALMRAARRGVDVYFVLDEMGSPRSLGLYLRSLRRAGVRACCFRSARGWRHRFQWNFRNHRKIVVVDGKVALVGGLNIADKYLGKKPRVGPWRDTHCCLSGPAVLGVQAVFAEDYFWASGEQLLDRLRWDVQEAPLGSSACTYLSTGPVDRSPVALRFLLGCIQVAQQRLWMTSPYFVPDPALVHALQLAAMRGVRIRLLLPPGRLEPWMRLAAEPFLKALDHPHIEIWEYPFYNHSKVMLVDDWLGWVGSSNLDNRSLRLNFEGNLVVADPTFAARLEVMLQRDFEVSHQPASHELYPRGWRRSIARRLIRLLNPVL